MTKYTETKTNTLDRNTFVSDNRIERNISILPSIANGLKNGDHTAFESIFHSFYARVKSFIKVIIKTDDLAEELTQQLFVNLWIHREKVNPEKNLATYIYTMAKNIALSTIKQQVKFETGDFSLFNEKDNNMTDDELIAKETELLINLTVASMPPKRRQVYEMSRIEEKTNEQIANELNISRKVVEKHLRFAVKELREVLLFVIILISIN